MTGLLDPRPFATDVRGPSTSMTSVAVPGATPAALAELLHQLADRVAQLGHVDIHDIVVTPTRSPRGSSTATVYFVA